MKLNIKIKYRIISIITCLSILIYGGCKIDDMVDPNNPSLEGVLEGATIPELNNIVVGAESGMRDELQYYLDNVGVVGREMYRFSGSDPRYTADLLGKGSTPLDDNAFYTTRPWNSFYRVVKNCNILLQAVDNTDVPSEAQKQGYRAFANTIKAYSLLLALNMTNENGIRVDVTDPENLGPIVDKNGSLAAIAALLDEAVTQLDASGASFAFALSDGFASIKPVLAQPLTPADFRRFNRALAARVAVYRGNYADALTLLGQSFFNLNGNFNIGVYHIYSTAAGDILNQFFYAPNSTGEVRPAHPSFLQDPTATPGDLRLNKVAPRTTAVSSDGLSSTHDVVVYANNVSPIPIIRNEELILIYAEAKIQTNVLGDAVTALNIIRAANNLPPYAGAVAQANLITEMLNQRRYSLFIEGHRWIDMRRYNRLNELPIDRTGDNVWRCFPIPFPENETSTCQE